VDDMTLSGPRAEVDRLAVSLRSNLRLKVWEPLSPQNPLTFLGRQIVQRGDGSIMIVPNRGLISKLGDLLGLQLRSNSTQTPAPTVHEPMTGERLDEATHSVYRSVVGVLQYIMGDRPDIQWAVKTAARSLATPCQSDMQLVKHTARYVLGTSGLGLLFERQEADVKHYRDVRQAYHSSSWNRTDGKYPHPTSTGSSRPDKRGFRPITGFGLDLRVFVDSDWAGDRQGARSTSGGCAEVSGCPLGAWSRTQSVVAQSSGEAELMSLTTGLSEGLGLLGLMSGCLLPASLTILTDSNAGRQTCHRTGVGRVKHLDIRYLTVQLLLRQKQFELQRVPGVDNPSDLLTKNVSRQVLERLRSGLHLVPVDREVGMLTSRASKRQVGKEAMVLAATLAWARAREGTPRVPA